MKLEEMHFNSELTSDLIRNMYEGLTKIKDKDAKRKIKESGIEKKMEEFLTKSQQHRTNLKSCAQTNDRLSYEFQVMMSSFREVTGQNEPTQPAKSPIARPN